MGRKLDPTILVIFGITGDLSREKLLPALYHLHQDGLLPKKIAIVGFARSEFTHQSFRRRIKPKNIRSSSSWLKFAKKIYYHRGDITEPSSFQSLADLLQGLETRGHSCANRLFYFATLPTHYETISHGLGRLGSWLAARSTKDKPARSLKSLLEPI